MGSKVKRLDVFGLPVALNLGQDSKFRTSFGLFMSICFYAALGGYLLLGPAGSLVGIRDRDFTYLATTNSTEGSFFAGNGRLKFAIGLQTKENAENIKDPRIFGIRAKYEVRRPSSDASQQSRTISYNLKVEPCRSDYFPAEIRKSLKLTEELYCLSEDQATLPESEQSMKIEGRFDSSNQGKIVITMERCKVDCRPKEVIDDILGKSNIAIYTVNYGISLKNETHPFQKVLMGSFLSADSRFTKLLDIFMKKILVESDMNYFLNNNMNKSEYIVVDGSTESISSEHEQIIFRTQLQMSSKFEYYQRVYKKVFSVVAEIGGFLKAFVLFAFLYRPFLKRLYFMEIINNLYRLERNKPLSNVKISEEQEERIRSMPRDQSIMFKEKDADLEKIIKAVKEKEAGEGLAEDNPAKDLQALQHPTISHESEGEPAEEPKRQEKVTFVLKYNWMDWIAIVCPCLKTKKHKLLDKGKKIVENNTDITVIIRKLQEFELLKKLILDKDQEILFNKIPKPNLLEIVDLDGKADDDARREQGPLGRELKENQQPFREEAAETDILRKIERQAAERERTPTQEVRQIQEVYDRLNKDRKQSALNDKLLTALEEYVVKSRTENPEQEMEEPPRLRPSRGKKPKDDNTDSDIL